MASSGNTLPKDACPHCGRSVGLVWWNLLPSRDNKRFMTCKACGGHFDLANACKMAAVISGMIGLALGMFFPFQWIVAFGHGSKLSLLEGVAAAALTVVLVATTTARIALRLEPKT